ncbi:uncharacterized protein LOC129831843 isoform X1 [Salvelinus fontinalis]|uniref:uncharacterized protein LOC129831843 isoform X1 n=1 Tax=Salvelinus fontinalis TaxID=8038 RepID=UPI002484EF23|nr:uncharacterized protein LOC129831843 isoform X1 [Salvelinus fontinalis]
MSREISSLSYTIKATEQQLSIEYISFLQNYKATETRAKQTMPDPKRVSGALIDVAKHLGNLQLRVREKMKGMVQYGHNAQPLNRNKVRGRSSAQVLLMDAKSYNSWIGILL